MKKKITIKSLLPKIKPKQIYVKPKGRMTFKTKVKASLKRLITHISKNMSGVASKEANIRVFDIKLESAGLVGFRATDYVYDYLTKKIQNLHILLKTLEQSNTPHSTFKYAKKELEDIRRSIKSKFKSLKGYENISYEDYIANYFITIIQQIYIAPHENEITGEGGMAVDIINDMIAFGMSKYEAYNWFNINFLKGRLDTVVPPHIFEKTMKRISEKWKISREKRRS